MNMLNWLFYGEGPGLPYPSVAIRSKLFMFNVFRFCFSKYAGLHFS